MPSQLSLPDVLAATPIFSGLNTNALSDVAAAMNPVSFTSGQLICGRGDIGTELFVVLDGRVKVSVLNADGRELAFTHVRAGELFGEIAMFDGGERTADVTALTKVSAAALPRTAADELMRTYPEIAQNVIRFLCGRLRQTDLQIEGIALHRIEVRLARYLDLLCRQAAPDQHDGDVEITLPISQGELAVLLGASRPKVNGALALIEGEGAVRRDGKTWICNVGDLRAIGELE
ncbi:MAG: Crp/Fnr family transcriptional regulator [Pseudomonadota bacterium]